MPLQTTLTDHPEQLFTISDEFDPKYPSEWFVVFPKSTQLDLANEDRPIACFELEGHATQFAERWSPFVEIIQNGKDNNE